MLLNSILFVALPLVSAGPLVRPGASRGPSKGALRNPDLALNNGSLFNVNSTDGSLPTIITRPQPGPYLHGIPRPHCVGCNGYANNDTIEPLQDGRAAPKHTLSNTSMLLPNFTVGHRTTGLELPSTTATPLTTTISVNHGQTGEHIDRPPPFTGTWDDYKHHHRPRQVNAEPREIIRYIDNLKGAMVGLEDAYMSRYEAKPGYWVQTRLSKAIIAVEWHFQMMHDILGHDRFPWVKEWDCPAMQDALIGAMEQVPKSMIVFDSDQIWALMASDMSIFGDFQVAHLQQSLEYRLMEADEFLKIVSWKMVRAGCDATPLLEPYRMVKRELQTWCERVGGCKFAGDPF